LLQFSAAAMKKTSAAFVNHLLVYLLVTIGFGGTIGLGTVWARHQISVLAEHNRQLAAQLTKVEDRIRETETLVETAKAPELLRQLNTQWGLGLVSESSTGVTVVPVPEDPVTRMVTRSNGDVFAERAPVVISFPRAPR
jgi:hypothetical protein